MTTKIPLTLTILGCCATLAAAPDLNIKPGLWEFTVTGEIKGDPMSMMSAQDKAQMEEAKAHMSPEQRAQMEAFQKQLPSTMAKPTIKRTCLTKENIRTSLSQFAAENSADKDKSNCKITPVRSTATVVESREVCSGNGTNSMSTLIFEAPNPETVTFRLEGSAAGRGTPGLIIKSTGKWLGPACGDVSDGHDMVSPSPRIPIGKQPVWRFIEAFWRPELPKPNMGALPGRPAGSLLAGPSQGSYTPIEFRIDRSLGGRIMVGIDKVGRPTGPGDGGFLVTDQDVPNGVVFEFILTNYNIDGNLLKSEHKVALRGKVTLRRKKLQLAGSKESWLVYTTPCWRTQNGIPVYSETSTSRVTYAADPA